MLSIFPITRSAVGELAEPKRVVVPVNTFPNVEDAVVVPTSKYPSWVRDIRVAPVEDAIANGFTPPRPSTDRVATGDEVPIPTFPFERTVKSDDVANPAEVVDATEKSGVVFPNEDWMNNLADGVEVPIPTLPLLNIENLSFPVLDGPSKIENLPFDCCDRDQVEEPMLSVDIQPSRKRVDDAPRLYVRVLSGMIFLNEEVAEVDTNP